MVDIAWFLLKSGPHHQAWIDADTTDDEHLSEEEAPEAEDIAAQALGLERVEALETAPSHAAAAAPYLENLRCVKRKLDATDALLSAPLAVPYLEELVETIVTRQTLCKGNIVPVVARYAKDHPDMQVRVLANCYYC